MIKFKFKKESEYCGAIKKRFRFNNKIDYKEILSLIEGNGYYVDNERLKNRISYYHSLKWNVLTIEVYENKNLSNSKNNLYLYLHITDWGVI